MQRCMKGTDGFVKPFACVLSILSHFLNSSLLCDWLFYLPSLNTVVDLTVQWPQNVFLQLRVKEESHYA